MWTIFDLLLSEEHSLTTDIFYLLSSVEQTCDNFSSKMIPFDSLLYKEQTYKIGICCVPVICVLTWSTCKLSLIIHLAICLAR